MAGGEIVTAAGTDVLVRGVPSGSFADLSRRLQQKLKDAGPGDEYGSRTATKARAFYHDSVPDSVRNLGEDSVRRYLAGKDASHIVSKENAPPSLPLRATCDF